MKRKPAKKSAKKTPRTVREVERDPPKARERRLYVAYRVKARIGNVIIKRVGDAWHVYALGPVVWADSFEEAVIAAQRMVEAQDEPEEVTP